MFTNKTIHMIGIGGISMSGIAEILLSFNNKVTGYDLMETPLTKHLGNRGIEVNYVPNTKRVDEADIIVYTAAIPEDHEELVYAKKLHKELYERSVFLGLLMKGYKNVLCISGTHGKSTTTGMVSQIFMEANLNPTVMIGAMLPIIGGNNHVGSKEYFIAESCEYVDSFLDFFPTSEIILNIDDDHLDYFGNIDNIINSFKRFTNLLPEDGFLVCNQDDENTKMAVKDHDKKITYGIDNTAMFMAKDISYDDFGHACYSLYINNEKKCDIKLSVSGHHNIYNSLAAITLAYQYNIDLDTITQALHNYTGVGRRFEHLGNYNGIQVYDDYAHHPSEIKTTLDSVKKTKHKENWAIFQSHTYSRTKDHMDEFAEVLSKFDHVIIATIFPAREENIYNVKEEDLVKKIKENGNDNVLYIDDFDKIKKYIKANAQSGDLVITIGAGNANKISQMLVSEKD